MKATAKTIVIFIYVLMMLCSVGCSESSSSRTTRQDRDSEQSSDFSDLLLLNGDYSEGLSFSNQSDTSSAGTCMLMGRGSCSDTDIVVPPIAPNGKTVTAVASNAFYGNDSITSIVLPDTVTEIGNSSFSMCDSLNSIYIPESVTRIGSEAFLMCDSLSSISIPDSVVEIGRDAFVGCHNLITVTIPQDIDLSGYENAFVAYDLYDDATYADYDGYARGPGWFGYCESLSSINGIEPIDWAHSFGVDGGFFGITSH